MTDLISRQAVEDLIMETDPWWCEGMTRAILEGVKRLPTIEPKRGRWVNDRGLYKCSVCGELLTGFWAVVDPEERMYKEMKHCPNCGADMRERSEE